MVPGLGRKPILDGSVVPPEGVGVQLWVTPSFTSVTGGPGELISSESWGELWLSFQCQPFPDRDYLGKVVHASIMFCLDPQQGTLHGAVLENGMHLFTSAICSSRSRIQNTYGQVLKKALDGNLIPVHVQGVDDDFQSFEQLGTLGLSTQIGQSRLEQTM